MSEEYLYKAIKVSVSSFHDHYSQKYTEIAKCDNRENIIETICKTLATLAGRDEMLENLRAQISSVHCILKDNLDNEFSPFHYKNKIIMNDHFGGFDVHVQRVLMDERSNEATKDYCIRCLELKQDTNWGANLRAAAKRMLNVADLSYFSFLESKGAKIHLPDDLLCQGKIKGYWEFQVAGFLLWGMAYEGYINYLGEFLFDDWKQTERTQSTLDKTRRIATRVSIQLNEDARPFSTIKRIFEIRNDLAHPKCDNKSDLVEDIVSKEEINSLADLEIESRLAIIKRDLNDLAHIIDEDMEGFLKILWKESGLFEFSFHTIDEQRSYSHLICND